MMWMPGMMLIGALIGLLVLALIAVGIGWLLRELGMTRGDRALQLLRERYARGEISREEFEQQRRDLI